MTKKVEMRKFNGFAKGGRPTGKQQVTAPQRLGILLTSVITVITGLRDPAKGHGGGGQIAGGKVVPCGCH
jgi:hypothetical protein